MSECSVDDCHKPAFRRGWCAMHSMRMRRNGVLDWVNPAGYKNKYPVGYVCSYAQAHQRMGSASVHMCAGCGAGAHHWGYKGGDPNEVTETNGKNTGLRYSLDASFYEPLCAPCHGQRDHSGDDNPAAKLTQEQAVAIVAEYATGAVTQKALAERYGITQGHVSDLVNGKRRAIVAVLAADTRKGVASRDEVAARRGN